MTAVSNHHGVRLSPSREALPGETAGAPVLLLWALIALLLVLFWSAATVVLVRLIT